VISFICSLFLIACFIFIKKQRTHLNTIILYLGVCGAVASFFWCLELTVFDLDDGLQCAIAGSVKQFFFLSTFCWTFFVSISRFVAVRNLDPVDTLQAQLNKLMYWYHAIGWGLPVISVIILNAANAIDSTADYGCWISEAKPGNVILRTLLFVLPFILVVVFHVIQLLLQSRSMKSGDFSEKSLKFHKKVSIMKSNANLFVVIFVTLWIWPVLDVFQEFIQGEQSAIIVLLEGIVTPLFGLANLWIFGKQTTNFFDKVFDRIRGNDSSSNSTPSQSKAYSGTNGGMLLFLFTGQKFHQNFLSV